MLTPVNSTIPSALKLPAKAHVDTASASLFGMVFQQNTKQFATLETAQAIAKMLGGTVVDLSDQWGGGSQSPQYAIQMGLNGPVLNAGLIAQRCENCGVESGLSAALVETGRMLGSPISDAEALAKVRANALATAQPTSAVPVTMAPPATIHSRRQQSNCHRSSRNPHLF